MITLKVSPTGVVCDTYETEAVASILNGRWDMHDKEGGYGYIHIKDIPQRNKRHLTKQDKHYRAAHWSVRTSTNPIGAWDQLFLGKDITTSWPIYKESIINNGETL